MADNTIYTSRFSGSEIDNAVDTVATLTTEVTRINTEALANISTSLQRLNTAVDTNIPNTIAAINTSLSQKADSQDIVIIRDSLDNQITQNTTAIENIEQSLQSKITNTELASVIEEITNNYEAADNEVIESINNLRSNLTSTDESLTSTISDISSALSSTKNDLQNQINLLSEAIGTGNEGDAGGSLVSTISSLTSSVNNINGHIIEIDTAIESLATKEEVSNADSLKLNISDFNNFQEINTENLNGKLDSSYSLVIEGLTARIVDLENIVGLDFEEDEEGEEIIPEIITLTELKDRVVAIEDSISGNEEGSINLRITELETILRGDAFNQGLINIIEELQQQIRELSQRIDTLENSSS